MNTEPTPNDQTQSEAAPTGYFADVQNDASPAAPEAAASAATTDAPVADTPAAETPAAEATPEAATTEAAPEPAKPTRQPSMAQVMESDEFSNYMSGADSLTPGALLKGIVVHIDENTGETLVDIGTKSEGIIPKNELGNEEFAVGDEIEVVLRRREDDEGHPVLSKARADYERLWRVIQQRKEDQIPLEGTVREQVRGGLIVDLGVPAFVPASHVDTRHRGSMAHLVGRPLLVRVIEIDRKKDRVIASHRLAVEEDRKTREESAWANLTKDKVVEGVVRRITDFGAFVDLGGVDGLLHVREMSWGRVDHPDHVVKKGQKLQVLVLDVSETPQGQRRVALGLKQLLSDPWKKAAKAFTVGQTVPGKITHLAESCAFVELEDGIEGIIPISEISEERIKTPGDVLTVGQEVEARVKQVQPNQRRITLSLRAAVKERERRETRTAVREVNQRSGADETLRLGDIFGQQFREAQDKVKERKKSTRSEARERANELAELEEWDDDEVVDVVDEGVEDPAAVEEAAEPEANEERVAEIAAEISDDEK